MTHALAPGWRSARLGDVCEKITDGTHRSPSNGATGIPYITAKNIRAFTIDTTELTFVSPEDHADIYKRCDPRYGDVLYIKDGATMGIAAVNRLPYEFSMLSSVALLRPKSNTLDPEFLAAWLNHPSTLRSVREDQTGSAIKRMVIGQIVALPIALPPLAEQRRIAALLRAQLDAVRRAREAALARLEVASALPAAFLRESFAGITPLSVEAKRDPAPGGWSWYQLSDLARLESGHTPSRYHPEWWGGTIPWIALPDIRRLDGGVALETAEYTNEAGIANSSARVLPKDTVVLSRTASVGFVTIMGREMATSQDFVNWVCGERLDHRFLAFLLRASRAFIRSLSSGAVHETVYMPTVKAFNVCVPTISEQRRLADNLQEAIGAAEESCAIAEGECAAIEALPQSLLRMAFAGGV
jgi:type I restriction enzyme S subunit